MNSSSPYDIAVIGGGFFGCSLSTHLSRRGSSVVLIEQDQEFLTRASYANQARVHNGYHYPRSLLTALRSRVNYPRFRQDYASCIYDRFTHYYAVPRKYSKVTALQFRHFMNRIGAPVKPVEPGIRKMFSSDLVEEVFSVEECAFDATALRRIASDNLDRSEVTVCRGTEVTRIRRDGKTLQLECERGGVPLEIEAGRVINCTYSRINTILQRASLPPLKLKHEITEMALVEVPDELRAHAFTLMCGPFFSLMPFPARGLHTLSHVRYTPHCSWSDSPETDIADAYKRLAEYPKQSKYEHMRRDAARFIPWFSRLTQRDSLWEVKTVLPQSEADDSRPILFCQAESEPRIWCIMGGKIDNIYDALEQWD
jgi:glycine/D-amino acid oxidase-like deaminating enzyme